MFVQRVAAQTKQSHSQKTNQQFIDTKCLEDKPKPQAQIELGVLNKNARLMPKPKYSTEAIRNGISGEVIVEIVIEPITGMIEWAKVQSGDPLLQEAVKKVLCRVRFDPVNDVNIKTGGLLIYRFKLPRHHARRNKHFLKM